MLNENLLKAKMVMRGMNSSRLAKSIGVSPTTISNVLTGKTSPSYYVLKKIVIHLDLDGEDCKDIFFPTY